MHVRVHVFLTPGRAMAHLSFCAYGPVFPLSWLCSGVLKACDMASKVVYCEAMRERSALSRLHSPSLKIHPSLQDKLFFTNGSDSTSCLSNTVGAATKPVGLEEASELMAPRGRGKNGGGSRSETASPVWSNKGQGACGLSRHAPGETISSELRESLPTFELGGSDPQTQRALQVAHEEAFASPISISSAPGLQLQEVKLVKLGRPRGSDRRWEEEVEIGELAEFVAHCRQGLDVPEEGVEVDVTEGEHLYWV